MANSIAPIPHAGSARREVVAAIPYPGSARTRPACDTNVTSAAARFADAKGGPSRIKHLRATIAEQKCLHYRFLLFSDDRSKPIRMSVLDESGGA